MQEQHTSVTPQTSLGNVAKCVPLSAVLSDISKLDYAGGKFKLLPEYFTERRMKAHFKEEEPCILLP